MAKLTLNNVGNGGPTGITAINTNFEAIQEAIENTISRDGTLPNELSGDLDVNNNNLLNIGDLEVANLIVDGVDVGEKIDQAVDAADSAAVSAGQAAVSSADAIEASQEATDLVIAATSGFTGFVDGLAYDFGLITAPMTYFNRDWGTL
jgi:hypothetical protein